MLTQKSNHATPKHNTSNDIPRRVSSTANTMMARMVRMRHKVYNSMRILCAKCIQWLCFGMARNPFCVSIKSAFAHIPTAKESFCTATFTWHSSGYTTHSQSTLVWPSDTPVAHTIIGRRPERLRKAGGTALIILSEVKPMLSYNAVEHYAIATDDKVATTGEVSSSLWGVEDPAYN